MQIINWFAFNFDYAYLIRLRDVTKTTILPLILQSINLQIFKRPQLPHFSTNLDVTGIKIHGLLRSFIYNILIIRVAIPFKQNLLA